MPGRACDLCGLDCGKRPIAQRVADRDRSFCCIGCMNVYVILSESGVLATGTELRETELFKRSLEMGLISQGDRILPSDPQQTTAAPAVATEELLLDVTGMWCSSCAWLIEHVVDTLPGVVSTEVYFASDTAKIIYQPQILPSHRINERVSRLGYDVQPHSEENASIEAERSHLLVRTGLAFFFWLNIMTFSLAVYASYFEPIADSGRRYVPFLLMALATPVVFYCAQPILRLAWRGLLNRTVRMETLLALGILSAYFYSSVQAFRGETHIYFDTASAIVALVLAGKSIERTAKERTTRWLAALHRTMPSKARVVMDGQERLVSIDALQAGQVFVVRPGERIPADGIVISGEAHADESLLTGEAAPLSKRPGSSVVGGSINADAVLHIQASRNADESAMSQVIRLTEKALTGRSDIERTVDRVSRIFVPAVVLVAVATFLFCWATHAGAAQSLMRSIAVLVIACPCALGLATPLAITAAIGKASRRGILVSNSRVLEALPKVDVVILDKTGTVTDGRFSLTDYHLCTPECEPVLAAAADEGHFHPEPKPLARPNHDGWTAALARIAALESNSEHPLARAVVDFARQHGLVRYESAGISIRKGMGLTGTVAGQETFVGNRRLLQSLGVSVDAESEQLAQVWEHEGETVSFFGWSGGVHGVLAFGDRLRGDARMLVSELKHRGINVHLVSGDSAATTRSIASRIGADAYRAESLPHEKMEMVRQLQHEGRKVAMVGDGINDAPALAQADLGIAMGSGTDIAMKAAAVVIMSGSISKVLDIFGLAGKTIRIVRQNLFWAFFYNVLGISLAIAGILNPIFAAGAMLLSSVCVIGNSLRLTASTKAHDHPHAL
jgi:P-type Cu2+ transporter